jgi:tRNA nucleotidyltransferase/poly(A) polymerase
MASKIAAAHQRLTCLAVKHRQYIYTWTHAPMKPLPPPLASIHYPLALETPAELAALKVIQTLCQAGHQALLVGGAVRDRLLQRRPVEADVASSARPEEVQALFPRTVAVGAAFGVIVVVMDEINIEVATFRADDAYIDGRRPTSVRFVTAAEDAARRDFTINALFYDPATCTVLDYTGGLADLAAGQLRAIGEAAARFREDYLRMLRAVRFTVRLGFALEPSPERLFQELTKLLTGPRPHAAFRLLDDCGLLAVLLPEMCAMKGVTQPPQYHPEGDVFVHTLLLLEYMVHPSPALAWSVLLHDVGKPPTFARGANGQETFPCHADVGAVMAEDILRRLRAPNDLTETVVAAVKYHMTFGEIQRFRPATLRRMMGRTTFPLELELHRIDCLACHRRLENWVFLLDQLHALANQPAVPPPLLTGADVLAQGVPPGPRVGALLREAQERQLNGDLADRPAALAWLASQLGAGATA